MEERQADTRLLAVNKLNQEHFTEILSDNVSTEQKTEFAAFLTDNLIGLQQSRLGYTDIAFIDSAGTVIISTKPEQVGQPALHNKVFAETLLASDGIFTQDIHFDPNTGSTKMAFGYVIKGIDLETGQELSSVIGVVIVAVDMAETIYPLIGAWPGMGQTGETLLVRNEN